MKLLGIQFVELLECMAILYKKLKDVFENPPSCSAFKGWPFHKILPVQFSG